MQHTLESHTRYVNLEYLAKLSQNPADILLAGWYGAENFGDELMLQTVLETVPSELLERFCVLLWDNYFYPLDQIDPRVTILHYPNSTWELDQLANHFSTLVWGGGAIIDERQFTEDPSNINTGNLFIRLSRCMLARGKRVFSLGLSSNRELSDERYLLELDEIVRHSALFSVRDPYSKSALEQSGITANCIELCEDLAFANSELASLPKHNPRPNVGTLRIALILLTTPDKATAYKQLIQSLLELSSNCGRTFELHLIPFLNERHGEDDGRGYDERYLSELVEKIDGQHVFVNSFCHAMGELHLEEYDLVISYKYHAALIALAQGTPTLCVYESTHPHYQNKVTHLAHLFSVQDCLYSSTQFESNICNIASEHLAHPIFPKPCEQILKNERLWLSNVCSGIVGDS